MALQEIQLVGFPTVSVRAGASLVRNGQTGVIVDRLRPGLDRVENDHDMRSLAQYLDAINLAQET